MRDRTRLELGGELNQPGGVRLHVALQQDRARAHGADQVVLRRVRDERDEEEGEPLRHGIHQVA